MPLTSLFNVLCSATLPPVFAQSAASLLLVAVSAVLVSAAIVPPFQSFVSSLAAPTKMGARLSRLCAPLSPWRRPADAPTASAASGVHRGDAPCSAPHAVPAAIHVAEAALMSQLTDVPYEKRQIALPSNVQLNTLSAGDRAHPTLLLLHGWGAGAAFFAPNLRALTRHYRVHIVDWPGFAASSRPHFDRGWSHRDAELFFVDALREWVAEIPKYEPEFPPRFHIAAHSLGAYLATVYALREPHRVFNLVLVSPVGLPRMPHVIIPSRLSWVGRLIFRLIFALWDAGLTPQMAIRLLGPVLGRRVARHMIAPRLKVDDEDAQHAVIEYFYQISNGACSGELSLSTILQSGAWARRPLCDRLHHVQVPVSFLYGDRDWMSADTAEEVSKNMTVPTEVVTVPEAGHHVYFDNVDCFNRHLISACESNRTTKNPPATAPTEQLAWIL